MKSYKLNQQGQIAVRDTRMKFDKITEALKELVPKGREQSLMITNLEQAEMWGVRAISLNEENQDEQQPSVD